MLASLVRNSVRRPPFYWKAANKMVADRQGRVQDEVLAVYRGAVVVSLYSVCL